MTEDFKSVYKRGFAMGKEEGIKQEIDRRNAWLNRIRTWHPDKAENWLEGYEAAERRIAQVLEDHVWQIDVKYKIFGFKWKQRCRCGSYGVFNEHLLNMIGAQNNEE